MHPPEKRIVFIDWLRTIAISLVVLRHLFDRRLLPDGATIADPVSFVASAIAGYGWTGVHIFFLVSGYLVGGHVIAAMSSGRFSPTSFFVSRALRILPAAYAVIIVVGVLAFNDGHLFKGIIKNFFFIQTYTSGGFMSHFWSLCVEWHFYLILPLVAYIFRGASISPKAITAFIIAFILVRAVAPMMFGGYLMKPTMTHWLPDFFVVGALFRFWSPRIHIPAFAAATVFAVSAIAVALIAGNSIQNVGKATWGVTLIFALISSSSVFLAAQQTDFDRLGWINTPVQFIARLSYSIYLVHLPIIEYVNSVPVALFATSGAALLLHYVVERPFLAAKESRRNRIAALV